MICSGNQRTSRDAWIIPSSTIAQNTQNPIAKVVDEMNLTPNPEKDMIALSKGDPTTFGNLPCAPSVNEAVIAAVNAGKHNGYSPCVGYEASRAAVAEFEQCEQYPITAKDVILSHGCSGALDMAITVLTNPGQNILIPRPGFCLYRTLALSLGITCKEYNLLPEQSWEIDLEHMESLLDDQTACIIVNNPSNPCGSVFSRQHILDILEIAARHKVPIIADEIYAQMVFPPHEYISMASLSVDVPILSCGGITKRFLIPGWRMGWVTIHDRHQAFQQGVHRGLQALSQRILGPNTVVQAALVDIITKTPQEFFDTTLSVVQSHATIAYEALSKVPGLRPVMPQGAMYMMVGIDIGNFPHFKSDIDFTEALYTEQSVCVLPGECFQYPNYFRIVLTIPEEKMKIACERIAEFCQEHY